MRVPISWIKDFVDINVSIEELARQLTMAGLEVEEIIFVGLPLPGGIFRTPEYHHYDWHSIGRKRIHREYWLLVYLFLFPYYTKAE